LKKEKEDKDVLLGKLLEIENKGDLEKENFENEKNLRIESD